MTDYYSKGYSSESNAQIEIDRLIAEGVQNITEAFPIDDKWHFNVRHDGELSGEWVYPETPYRVWAQ